MKLHSFILYILWSSSATTVWLFEISSTNPCGVNTIQSSYYLEADANSNSIEPNEELKRTQRSFLKKLWKDSGLEDLFRDDGCVTCCNNDNYNAGEGDTYEAPPTSSYIPYFQQIPPLSPLQPFDPLRIFQPFLRPMDFNTNGLNEGGQINTYDKGNIPKIYKGENTNVINNDKKAYIIKNSETSEAECKNIKKNKVKENNSYSNDNSNNIGPIYTEENDAYQKTDTEPVDNVYVYPEHKSKSTQTKQEYPALNGSSGRIVYQPIIYVSPQYHAVPPLYNAAHNSNQKNGELNLHYPNAETQHNIYNTEMKEYPPTNGNFKGGPDIKVSYSDQSLPCAVSPYSTVLSNNAYTPLPPSSVLPPGPSTYGVVSQCSDTKVTPSDIAIYTLVTQIPSTFGPSSKTQIINGNPYSYLNTINNYYKETTPQIQLTEADQPYRNCPELFTDYLNQGNYNQNHVTGKTFVNAQFISC